MFRNIELSTYNVKLNISVNSELKKEESKNLENFGFIEVTTGAINAESCFWDNISFFISASKGEFKEECRKELKEKGFKWKGIYKEIKQLIDEAIRLDLLT